MTDQWGLGMKDLAKTLIYGKNHTNSVVSEFSKASARVTAKFESSSA